MADVKQQGASPASGGSAVQDALKVGLFTGVAGFVVGSTAGVLRSTTPVLFGAASGLQWFGLGTAFWGTRSAILAAWYKDRALASPRDRVYASTAAGGFTGMALGFVMRGRRNVIPGGIMFSLFGALGQSAFNAFDARETPSRDESGGQEGVVKWIAKQSWAPFSILTDSDYERILREKIFRLDVEISLADDRLAEMKRKAAERERDAERK